MADNEEEQSEHHELVMPFVVCESVGGAYDDVSFVAGWQCGELYQQMAHGVNPIMVTRYRNLLPQFDLMAMNHGYKMVVDEDYIDALWVHVGFEKV